MLSIIDNDFFIKNLHSAATAAAQIVMKKWGAVFPTTLI
jgi:hypothetical protein